MGLSLVGNYSIILYLISNLEQPSPFDKLRPINPRYPNREIDRLLPCGFLALALFFGPSRICAAPSGADVFFLGESRTTAGAILHDRHGNLIVTGYHFANDSGIDRSGGFISKYKSSGRLVQTLDLRGTPFNDIWYAALDSHGRLWVLGSTLSNIPPVGASAQPENHGGRGMYIATLSEDGSSLILRSYFGGSGYDYPVGMGIDENDNIVIAGTAYSQDFPTTPDALPQIHSTFVSGEFFLTRLSPGASNIVYSTLIGSDGLEEASAFYMAPDGSVYLAGSTSSPDFPFSEASNFDNAFMIRVVCKLTRSNTLAFARQVRGASAIGAITVDDQKNIVLAGVAAPFSCQESEIPHIGFPENGIESVLLTKLDASGTLLWSRSIGGSGRNDCSGLLGTRNSELLAALHLDGLAAMGRFNSAGDLLQIEPISNGPWFRVTGLSEGKAGSIAISGYCITNWPANISYINEARVLHGFAAVVGFPNKAKSERGPLLSFSTPLPGQAFAVGESIEVTVGVFTIDAPLQAVRLFSGDALIGLKSEAPYTFNYSNSVPALQTLYAVALDRAGNSFTSGPVSFQIVGRPANDEITSAIRVTGSHWSVTGSSLGANASLDDWLYYSDGRSIWWSWTPPETGTYSLDAGGSEMPVQFSILRGSNLNQSNFVAVATASQFEPVAHATFKAEGGSAYYIVAGGRGTAQGRIQLNLRPAVFPPNDDLSNATPLGSYLGIVEGDDREASIESFEPGFPFGRSIWWSWTAPTTATYRVSLPPGTLGSQVDLYATYDGQAGVPLVGGSSGYDLFFSATAGGTYYLRFFRDGDFPDGDVSFEIAQIPFPANDDFDAAFPVEGASWAVEGTTQGATIESAENLPFYSGGSVWWRWRAPKSGRFLARILGYADYLTIFTGTSISNLTQVPALNFVNFGEFVDFFAIAGTEYRIAVVSFGPANSFKMTLREIMTPPNDDFANRILLTGEQFKTNGTCVGATIEPLDPHKSGPVFFAAPTVWYRWVAPIDGVSRIDLQPANECGVFTGTNRAELSQVAYTPHGLPLAFRTVAGQEYEIMVADSGLEFALSLRPALLAANDDFVNAALLPNSGEAQQCPGDATREPGEPPADGGTLWWRFTPAVSGRYSASSGVFYEGNSLDSLRPVPLNGVVSTNALQLADLVAGHEYRIQVLTGRDAIALRVLKVTSPTNDNFADRITVVGGLVTFSGSTEFATTEPGEPASMSNETLWWSWIAPRTARTSITLISSLPFVDVFTGTSLTNLTSVMGPFSSTFFAQAGQEYFIRVSSIFQYLFSVQVAQELPLTAAPSRLQISLSRSNELRLVLPALVDQVYVTEASTNLIHWMPIMTNDPVTINNGPSILIPPSEYRDSSPARFFRVRSQ